MIRILLLVALVFCAACSQRPSDQWIAAQIRAAFQADAAVKQANLSVGVKDGLVTLTGIVPGADVQLHAFKLAYATRGVNAIHDSMRVVAPASPFPIFAAVPTNDHSSDRISKSKPGFSFPLDRATAPPREPEIMPAPPDVLFEGAPEQEEQPASPSQSTSGLGTTSSPGASGLGAASGEGNGEPSFASPNSVQPGLRPLTGESPGNDLKGHDISRAVSNLRLNGAGTRGPDALFQKWFLELGHANSGLRVTYQGIGSGAGVKQLIAREVDFASTEQTLDDRQLKTSQSRLIHIPLMMHAVVPILNLPGSTGALNLPREALAKIFLGEITTWNDPTLVVANPSISLPARQIIVVHRSDDSSATQLWTAFLSKVSLEWQRRYGASDDVNWPTGMGGKGDEGVLGLVSRNQYSIGYVELGATSKLQNRSDIRIGSLQNASGNYVEAVAHTVEAAASGALAKSDAVGRMSILDTAGKDAYPVAGFEWIVLPEKTTDIKRKAEAVLLQWLFTRPQRDIEAFGYFALPEQMAKVYRSQISVRDVRTN